MDANTIDPHPGHEKVDCDDFLQTRSGRQYLRIPSDIVQPRRGHISKVVDNPAGRTSKNTFTFLLLPGELRNEIYKWTWWTPGCDIEGLKQPPITRVSRQLRHEALGLFYSEHGFWVRLPPIPCEHATCTFERRYPFSFASDMVHAFTPKPGSTLQTSSLSFLRELNFGVGTEMVWPETHRLVITMSEEEYSMCRVDALALRTAGLDWNDEVAVSEAFLEAARSCVNVKVAALALEDDEVPRRAEGAASQVARILCLIAEHCPQLTTFVLITFVLEHDVYNRVIDYCFEHGSDTDDGPDTNAGPESD